MKKPRLSFTQFWNMDFGFLGIQFGWGLQMANMSYIYSLLGAKPDKIPILWLAAPLTRLFVQPIIRYMSDRTWCLKDDPLKGVVCGGVFMAIGALLMMRVHPLQAATSEAKLIKDSGSGSREYFKHKARPDPNFIVFCARCKT